jgi:hypothetical protein
MWDTPRSVVGFSALKVASCIISPKQSVNDFRRPRKLRQGERCRSPFRFRRKASHVRSRRQAQAHRAGHPVPHHGALRVLRRGLLLPGGAHGRRVATVGGEKITQNDYADAVREQTEQMRRQLGRNFDARMFDNPEVRFAILDSLINQKLIANKARERTFA